MFFLNLDAQQLQIERSQSRIGILGEFQHLFHRLHVAVGQLFSACVDDAVEISLCERVVMAGVVEADGDGFGVGFL